MDNRGAETKYDPDLEMQSRDITSQFDKLFDTIPAAANAKSKGYIDDEGGKSLRSLRFGFVNGQYFYSVSDTRENISGEQDFGITIERSKVSEENDKDEKLRAKVELGFADEPITYSDHLGPLEGKEAIEKAKEMLEVLKSSQ